MTCGGKGFTRTGSNGEKKDCPGCPDCNQPKPVPQRRTAANFTSTGALAATIARYKAHNDSVAEKLGSEMQACTIADLEIITRQTSHLLTRALKRIARLEERVGIQGDMP